MLSFKAMQGGESRRHQPLDDSGRPLYCNAADHTAGISNKKTTGQAMSNVHIQLKLFAGLAAFTPENSDRVPIAAGVSVKSVLQELDIPSIKAHLIFINGIKGSLESRLKGGERVGIFPPVAGG